MSIKEAQAGVQPYPPSGTPNPAAKATTTPTAIHCPACGRKLTEAEEIKEQRLRCKSCGARLTINLGTTTLSVAVAIS